MVGLRTLPSRQPKFTGAELIEDHSKHITAYGANVKRIASCREIVIADPKAPDQTVACDIPWAALTDYCGVKHLKQYVVIHPNGSAFLRFYAFQCEPQGIHFVAQWVTKAHANQTPVTLPWDSITERFSLADLCCAQRALAVFGLDKESEELYSKLTNCLDSDYEIPTIDLEEALIIMPDGSHWSELLLRHISRRLASMYESVADEGHCFCGWEYQGDTSTHIDCLHNWVTNHQELRDLLAPQSDKFPSTKPSPPFGKKHCAPLARERIENWLLQIESQPTQTYSLGEFPHPLELVGPNPRIPTYMQSRSIAPIAGTYALRWSEKFGGCYFETRPNARTPSKALRPTSSTEFSREWLASRGYRGGAGSPSELDMPDLSSEPVRSDGENETTEETDSVPPTQDRSSNIGNLDDRSEQKGVPDDSNGPVPPAEGTDITAATESVPPTQAKSYYFGNADDPRDENGRLVGDEEQRSWWEHAKKKFSFTEPTWMMDMKDRTPKEVQWSRYAFARSAFTQYRLKDAPRSDAELLKRLGELRELHEKSLERHARELADLKERYEKMVKYHKRKRAELRSEFEEYTANMQRLDDQYYAFYGSGPVSEDEENGVEGKEDGAEKDGAGMNEGHANGGSAKGGVNGRYEFNWRPNGVPLNGGAIEVHMTEEGPSNGAHPSGQQPQ
jgi:hypothetical protein